MLTILFVLAAALIMLPGLLCVVLFVSIVWTHRPDLSVGDILGVALREVSHYRKIRSQHRAGREEK